MVTTLCLFTCALMTAQPPTNSDWQLRPQLSRGQELLYTGSYVEEVLGRSVRYQRTYDLENRVFVVDANAAGTKLTVLTTLRTHIAHAVATTAGPASTDPCSLRLDSVEVDSKGKLTLPVPLDGPATLEGELFAEVTRNYVAIGQTWVTTESGRPPRTWKALGVENLNGARCYKVRCTQQSTDWTHARADHVAWRRQDTLWILPEQGIASRVERVIEKREPAHLEPTQRSVTTYELHDSVMYPRQFYEDRVQEIRQARTFTAAAELLLRDRTRSGPAAFESVLDRIAFFTDNHPETPYRAVLRQLQRRLAAVRAGETQPVLVSDPAAPTPPRTSVDRAVPDVTTRDLASGRTFHFSSLRGKCALLIFFAPNSSTFEDVCSYGQKMQQKFGRELHVYGLSVGGEAEIARQWADKKFGYPLLAGDGLRLTFGVETTPTMVVIDAAGVIRGSYLGWGREMACEITDEIRHAVADAPKP